MAGRRLRVIRLSHTPAARSWRSSTATTYGFRRFLKRKWRCSASSGRAPELAAMDRQLERLEEARLLASGKANLVRRDFAAAADDFSSLRHVRRDFMSAAIARMSRHIPGTLLWGYRVKRAWNARARAVAVYFSQINPGARV